jgi:hypothetical protein
MAWRRGMAERFDTYLDRFLFRRTLARWQVLADRAGVADTESLRGLRTRGRQLRRQIDRALHLAEGRLARGGEVPAIARPLFADWTWRPELWSGPISPPGLAAAETRATFGSEAKLFHDCAESELTLRQVRNTRETDLAPFGVRMDVFRFDGSFLSLVLDLPEAGLQGLTSDHVVRLDVTLDTERPIEIFARLNVRHGPNTEQLVRELPRGAGEATVEFDLAYARINERRVEGAWLDLIFEGPEMNQILIRDLTMSRRPRAAL